MNENCTCAVCQRHFQYEKDYLTGTSRWRICSAGNLWFNCSCGSTLLVKKGRFSWYSPEKILLPEARGVFNQLGSLKELPHIPSSVMEILRLLQDENTSPKALASEIKGEPVLASQILQMAENIRKSRNPLNPAIKAIDHAIVYIGTKAFSDLVMAASVRMLAIPKSQYSVDQFWQESQITGVIAESIAQKFNVDCSKDQLFLSGTLCNIGKLVTAICFPTLINKVEAYVNSPSAQNTWRQAESTYKIPDHCILGEIAATLWGFPDFVMYAARKHHNMVGSARHSITIPEIIAFANQLTHWVLLRPHRIEYEVLYSFRQYFLMSEKELDIFASDLTKMINDPSPALNVS